MPDREAHYREQLTVRASGDDYDEPALAALVVGIASINTWNRLNVTTRQVAGAWTAFATSGATEPAQVG